MPLLILLGLGHAGGRVRFTVDCGVGGAAGPAGDCPGCAGRADRGSGRADRGVDGSGGGPGSVAAPQLADVVEAAVVGWSGQAAATLAARAVGSLPGKQPGEPGFTLRQVATPDEVLVHRPRAVTCAAGRCGGHRCARSRRGRSSTCRRWRSEWSSIAWSIAGAGAGPTTMARVPAGSVAPAQYGPRVRAIGAYLVGYQHLPYERACETLADLFGCRHVGRRPWPR